MRFRVGATIPLALVELVRWHSGLTVTSSDVCVNPEWKSTLTAIDAQDSAAFRVLHGAAGLRDVAADGFDYSFDSFDVPKGARKSARDPARAQDGAASRGTLIQQPAPDGKFNRSSRRRLQTGAC